MKAAPDATVMTKGSVGLVGAEGGPLSDLARSSSNGQVEYLTFDDDKDKQLVDAALAAALGRTDD